MTTMVTEVYDALREAGASEEKSRKAAEAVAAYDNRLAGMETKLSVLTYMVGTNIVITLGVLGRLLTH
jgi:hypothetical protein